jgi:hypothetical protein
MIVIVICAGGNIITGSTDIDYNNHPIFSFLGNEYMYFDEVITTIYKQLRLLENQYFLVSGLGIIYEVLVLIIFV